MTFETGDKLEAYTIEKCLSDTGGMSKIFLAYEEERPTRRVVLKVQRTGEKESRMFQDLLRQELAMLRSLRHPGIVRTIPMRIDNKEVVHEARAADFEGTPWYFAMEYLGGYSLTKHISQFPEDSRLSTRNPHQDLGIYGIDWSLELFHQIVQVVNYMHEKGVAHTDLKPDNIILRHVPSMHLVPQPVLIDFGSACQLDNMSDLTASVGYSPPEVIKAVKHKKGIQEAENIFPDKIDVWMLGVILFELLTGRRMSPFPKGGVLDTSLISIRSKKISRFRVDAHNSIDKLITAILNNDPQKRPSTRQILKALDEKIYSIRPPRIDNRPLDQ